MAKEAKHVTLTLSGTTDPVRNVMSGEDANAFISRLMNEGWEVKSTHFIGLSPDGISIFYLLIRSKPA